MLYEKFNQGSLPKEIIEHQDTNTDGRWLKDWETYTFDWGKIKNFKDYFLKNYEKVNEINEWLKEQEFNNPNSEIAKFAKSKGL